MPTHDLIIIGAGSGNSIIGPEHDDMDVAIVERGLFGGTCLNVGCIPSKAMIATGNARSFLRRSAGMGLTEVGSAVDLEQLEQAVGPRTKLVAAGLASNGTGTINPVPRIANIARSVGARLFVDAVAAVPHLSIDVEALGADYLVCSPYKFYGPHLGVLWGRRELLESLPERLEALGADAVISAMSC